MLWSVCVVCVVCVLCVLCVFVVCVVFCAFSPPSTGPPSAGHHPPPDRPKFRSCFPSTASIFALLVSLSGCLLVEFWWCFEAPGPLNVSVWSSRAVV